MAAGPTKKDVLVAWLGGALIGTIVGFNAGIYTGLGVLVPARDRRDKQTVVTVLGISSGVIGLAIWGTWTVRLCLFFAVFSESSPTLRRRKPADDPLLSSPATTTGG